MCFSKLNKRCEQKNNIWSPNLCAIPLKLHTLLEKQMQFLCCIFQRFCWKSYVFGLICEDFLGIGILMQNCKKKHEICRLWQFTLLKTQNSCLERDFPFEHGDFPFEHIGSQKLPSKTHMILLMAEILHQLRLVVFIIIFRVSYIPGGCLGFQPSTLYSILFGVWTVNRWKLLKRKLHSRRT